MMFISASDCGEKRLTNFAENVEVHFASRKKTEILAKARNYLLQCDFSIPQDYMSKVPGLKNGGKAANLGFLSERCVVSKAASQLMQLMHQTLKDVCLSSPRVALEFYHAARDAILLYEAVIPVKKGSWMASTRLLFSRTTNVFTYHRKYLDFHLRRNIAEINSAGHL